jgi:phage shock protein PspC (stress-responsive transcriptional regulator)
MTGRGDEASPLRHDQRRARRPAAERPLVRRMTGRRLGGVSSGIADFVGADVRIIRALWVVSFVLSLGIVLIGYVLLWILLPAVDEAP